jgi:chaperonin GroES
MPNSVHTTSLNALPLANRVVVRSLEAHDRTSAGLYVPDTTRERPQLGEIVAVGPGQFESGVLVPMRLKVGDRVLFQRSSGAEIELNGGDYLIMRETDVLMVLA